MKIIQLPQLDGALIFTPNQYVISRFQCILLINKNKQNSFILNIHVWSVTVANLIWLLLASTLTSGLPWDWLMFG